MGTYPYCAANACYSPVTTAEIDGELAGAGYRVLSSELQHVAQRLEQLETVMVSCPTTATTVDPFDVVHSNPSDIAAWVDSMLSEFNSCSDQALVLPPPPPMQINSSEFSSWPESTYPPPPPVTTLAAAAAAAAQRVEEEEDSGIRLVHLLMSCADSVHRAETILACTLLEEIKLLLSRVSNVSGIGKVAACFADALCCRIYNVVSSVAEISPAEHEILYHHFYEASPYLKFAHFTANQAILEAFDGYNCVHVVDFSLMQGLQWPALIQALALRPGGPPSLRLTGIGPPSPDGHDTLREVGLRLAELARSVGVRFAFRGVAANRLDDVKPWMLQITPGEALAFNSVLQLHKLVGEPGQVNNPVDSVLTWVSRLKPRIVTVVEQEAAHNKPGFIDRFTEALFYYSTVFDSLEASGVGSPNGSHGLAELYLQREICNVVCCEGTARVERHEPMGWWRARLGGAGLKPVHLGSNAFKQASTLLTLFSGEGYCVEEMDGCLTLGWHNRSLIAASAWRADDDRDVGLSETILNESNNNCDGNGNSSSSENNGSTSSY